MIIVRGRTEAFRVFETNLNRAGAFLRIFDADRTRGNPSADERELLRGCLVFAVGALDAYLSDLVVEIVPTHAPNTPRLNDALRQIAKANPGLSLRLAIAGSDSDRQEQFRGALTDWLDNQSFQGPAKVLTAIGYLGCSLTWKDFAQVGDEPVEAQLAKITNDRHDIVHRGKKTYVKRQLAGEAVDLVNSVAARIDSEVAGLYLGPRSPGTVKQRRNKAT